MSKESKIGLDKNLIFRESFSDAVSVAQNIYSHGNLSSTGLKFSNGVCSFNGVDGVNSNSISYVTRTARMYRIVCTINAIKNSVIFSHDTVSTNARGLSINTSQLYFQYGSVTTLTGFVLSANVKYDIILLQSTDFYDRVYVNGVQVYQQYAGNYFKEKPATLTIGKQLPVSATQSSTLNIELFEIYNRALSASEIKNLYQGTTYIQPKTLPLLLDFDSTSGVCVDRTGLNTLTPTNVSIQKVGKTFSAYFNNNGTISIPHHNRFNNHAYGISVWFKPVTTKGSGVAPGYQDIISKNYGATWALPYVTFRLYFDTNNKFNIHFSKDSTSYYIATIAPVMKYNVFTNFIVVILTDRIYIYVNGILISLFTSVNIYGTGHSGEVVPIDLSNAPYSIYPINIGVNSILGTPLRGNVPKVQIFQGIPSNPDQFASQLYSSQKQNFL